MARNTAEIAVSPAQITGAEMITWWVRMPE